MHRSGRTARAGAEGFAISFCDHEERSFLRDIERLIRMTLPSTDKRANRQGGEPSPTVQAARPHSPDGKPRNRAGQRRRQRERDGQRGPSSPQESRQAPAKANGGTADGALSSVGFMQHRRPERHATRRNAHTPR